MIRPPIPLGGFVPAHSSDTPARAGPVKIGRALVSIRGDISRPQHLEEPEQDGSLVCAGISFPPASSLVSNATNERRGQSRTRAWRAGKFRKRLRR
jgi:hypothetical protein